jgi:hypothetical protein
MRHFPDNILTAMKDAVINVFWKREDVRALFRRCNVPAALVNEQDWNRYKYHIVAPVLDALNTSADGLGPLRRIVQETLEYTSGDHLLWMNDGAKRKREAERSLEHLRLLVQSYDAAKKTEQEERDARIKKLQEAARGAAFQEKLRAIKDRFVGSFREPDAQQRGYGLEQILYDVFLLFELEPRGPFKRVGEQIDGAFVHDGDHFLLEAKWQEDLVNLADLRDLDGAANSSLDNTLGLFFSLNGFSEVGLAGYAQGSRPRIICMDGAHLMAVLDSRIDLSDLLRRMRDIAVQKRRIFVPVREILEGKV